MTLRPLLVLGAVLVLEVVQLTLPNIRQPAAGEPAVIDGDTLEVDGGIVQLYGIDAPELGQLCRSDGIRRQCGVQAALALRKLIALGGPVACQPWTDDPARATAGGATPEVCKLGHEDVALVMLHGGHAVALPNSFPDYLEAQDAARGARLGIWHSRFAMPWDWRAETGGPDRHCNVKAVHDAAGKRVYYVPTDPDYQAISVAPERDERLFCSDEEARTAGWARPTASSG